MLMPMLVVLSTLTAQQKPDLDAQSVERMNFYRKAAGLEPVTLDPALGKGCSLHAQYLATNAKDPSTEGLGMHNEDPKLPGYTAEGAKAGKASVIFPTGDPVAAVDRWMASLFHRVPLLDPTLTKVGFGFAKGGKWGGYVVLDTISGRGGKEAATPILYPADRQKDVPLLFGKEYPPPIPEEKEDKAGYPITVIFARKAEVKGVTATLQDSAMKEVPVWLSTPEEPAGGHKNYQRNTICLIAQAPLQPNTTYTVTVKAQVDKKEWSQTWSFTTGAAKK
jgi:hypothetical protein